MTLPRSLLLPALLLCSTAAQAATVGGVTVALNQANYADLSKYDCVTNGSTEIAFNYTFPYQTGQTVEYFLATDSGCATPQGSSINTGGTSSVNSVLIQTLSPRPAPSNSSTGLSFSDTVTNLTFGGVWNWYADYKNNANGSTALQYDPTPDPASCLDNINNVNVYLCVQLASPDTTTGTGGTVFPVGSIAISLESLKPSAPEMPSVTALDSALEVNWTAVSTPVAAFAYIVHVQDPTTNADVKTSEVTNGQVTARIDGLTNGTSYNVFVVALDDAGSSPTKTSNVSDPSPTIQAAPIPSISYFEEYHRNGGTDRGCSSTGAGSLFMLLPLLFLLPRRRKLAGLLGGLTLAAIPARAEEDITTTDLSAPVERKASPEMFRVELQTGPYNPTPDRGLSAPVYSRVFPSKNQLLTRLSFHVNVFGYFGHASVGASVGVWQVNGHALKEDHVTQAGDKESLTIYPITPMIGYRADFIFTKWKVPIVPYGKLGYGFTYFSDTKNGKTTSGTDPMTGVKWKSYGWAAGLEWAVGVEFPLDFLDPRRANNLDESYGINSTGIFGEYSYSYWEGMNGGKQPWGGGLNLNGATWSGGVYLAF